MPTRTRKPRRARRKRANNTNTTRTGGQSNVFTMPKMGSAIPTVRTGNRPYQVALTRTPLFPSAVLQRNMLYYDYQLSATMPNTGLAVTYLYTANGAWDPDITGSGHQYMGYDQMMAMYEQATVVRSTLTVTFLPGHQLRASLGLNPDTTAITDPVKIMENGLVVTEASPVGVTQNKLPSMTLDCDVRKYFGRHTYQDLLNDDKLASTAGSNPTEQVYYALNFWQAFGINSTQNVSFDVCLSADIIFWEPKKLAVS